MQRELNQQQIKRAGRSVLVGMAAGAAMCHLLPGAGWPAVSMLVSAGLYAAAFGWLFAVGLSVLLLIHELGHLLASRLVGLPAAGPVFLPFLGAFITLKRQPQSAKGDANIAAGGPALGTLAALVCLLLYFWTAHDCYLVLCYVGALLNFLNLLPCLPLDGGRMATAMLPRSWWLIAVGAAGLLFFTQQLAFLALLLTALWRALQPLGADEPLNVYYQLERRTRWAVTFWYSGIITVLSGLVWYSGSLL